MMDAKIHTALTAAFVRKAKLNPRQGYEDEDEWLTGLIGTVIIDTAMVLDGSLPIEVWNTK